MQQRTMPKVAFTSDQIKQCYDFAKNMIGKHNPNMIRNRTDQEIFRDDFRGKIGEVALSNYIKIWMPNVRIDNGVDYKAYNRGKWDHFDIIVNNQIINVKSIKRNSSFLMIEQDRFDLDGGCAFPNDDGSKARVDDYVLVRVIINWPDGKTANSDGINIHQSMGELLAEESRRKPESVYAEILGGVTSDDFWRNKHYARKGILCHRDVLKAVCDGKCVNKISNPQAYTETEILQQDNYILSCAELQDVNNLKNLQMNDQ